MKKTLFILLLFITIFSKAENKDYLLKISGKISDKYEIEMNLKISKNFVHGYYYYTKYKTKIPLIGSINNENSEISLIEKPWTENSLSHPIKGFNLKLKKNNIGGFWFDKTENKELSISGKLKNERLKFSEIQGQYESIRNSEKFQGNIQLIHIHDKIFILNISTYTESGCIGELFEIVNVENGKGTLKEKHCKLSIKVENNSVAVNEINCTSHGYRCYFDGKYIKQ